MSHIHRVWLSRGIGDGLRALGVLCVVTWSANTYAAPSGVGSAEERSVGRDAGIASLHDRLMSGEEALGNYARTGDRSALVKALDAASKMSPHFSPEALRVRQSNVESFDADDTIAFVRFSNLLSRYTGQPALFRQAQESLGVLKEKQLGLPSNTNALIRTVEDELRTAPLHITVVGAKDDARAQHLWREALRVEVEYLRREWWDRREGVLPNPDVKYPPLVSPAAFVCVDTRCSVPLYTEQELREKLVQRDRAHKE